MPRFRLLVLALAVLTAATVGGLAPGAAAQEPTPTTEQVEPEVPTGEIIPRPNSGTPPEEPGDRGGALQIGILLLVLLAIAGAVLGLVRQSRRARSGP